MTGLDDLLSGVLGGKGGGALGSIVSGLTGGGKSGGAAGGMASLLPVLLPLVGGLLAGGGLGKVLSGLQSHGLGSQADSWVGKGPNQPVSGDQVRQVIGDDQIAEIAQKLGVSHDQAAQAIAEVLPHVVDHVTPDGQVPPENDVNSSLEKLQQSAAHA